MADPQRADGVELVFQALPAGPDAHGDVIDAPLVFGRYQGVIEAHMTVTHSSAVDELRDRESVRFSGFRRGEFDTCHHSDSYAERRAHRAQAFAERAVRTAERRAALGFALESGQPGDVITVSFGPDEPPRASRR